AQGAQRSCGCPIPGKCPGPGLVRCSLGRGVEQDALQSYFQPKPSCHSLMFLKSFIPGIMCNPQMATVMKSFVFGVFSSVL
ncbi:hypothetical protein Nmel_012541, partial [Mimus melanotis]